MFGKLIKYEWKAMIRAMLPVYGATVAISLINGITLNSDLFKEIQGLGLIGDYSNILYSLAEFIQFLLAVLYVVMFVGLFVMTLIVTVRRFWNGLLKEEGYLMFTLPVKTSSLALSKAVVSFFIMCISGFVGILALALLSCSDPASLLELLGNIISLPTAIIKSIREGLLFGEIKPVMLMHLILYVLELIILVLSSVFGSIYMLYASMAMGQLSRNHKVAFSVLWYVVLNIAQSTVAWFAIISVALASTGIFSVVSALNAVAAMHILLIGFSILNIGFFIAFKLITDYILAKRLNLE